MVIIYNVLHEEIDRIEGARDLWIQDLRGRQWQHADLSGLSLFGAQCDGINLVGARLFRTDFQKASLCGAELAFSYADGASLRRCDDFTDALVNESTDIPEIKVFGERRL